MKWVQKREENRKKILFHTFGQFATSPPSPGSSHPHVFTTLFSCIICFAYLSLLRHSLALFGLGLVCSEEIMWICVFQSYFIGFYPYRKCFFSTSLKIALQIAYCFSSNSCVSEKFNPVTIGLCVIYSFNLCSILFISVYLSVSRSVGLSVCLSVCQRTIAKLMGLIYTFIIWLRCNLLWKKVSAKCITINIIIWIIMTIVIDLN